MIGLALWAAGIASSCTSTNASSTSRGVADIGPAGGVLEGHGVSITIPPGALAEMTRLTIAEQLTREALIIRVRPDIRFDVAATGKVDPALFEMRGHTVARHRELDGEVFRIDDVRKEGDALVFNVIEFTDVELIESKATSCDEPWSPNERWSPGRGDASEAASGARDATRTLQSVEERRKCLVNVRNLYGLGNADPPPPSPRAPDEHFMMSKELGKVLSVIDGRVQELFGLDYHVTINGAFDSSGTATVRGKHALNSHHSYGTAADISICKFFKGSCRKVQHIGETEKLAELARIATHSGATWVEWEASADGTSHHIHVSAPSAECGVTPIIGSPPPGTDLCALDVQRRTPTPAVPPKDAGSNSTCGGARTVCFEESNCCSGRCNCPPNVAMCWCD